jgi:molecular chaperone GrpE (heat shock protein)
MRTKSIIVGTILLFGGGSLLSWVLTDQKEKQAEADHFRLKYSTQTARFIKQYDEWLQRPADQRTELPSLLNEDGQAKQERLEGDIDKLATGEMAVPPHADVLYGENWQDELSQYKEHKAQNKAILTGSIVCTSAGGLVFVVWLLVWMVQTARQGVSRFKRWRSGEPEISEQTTAKKTQSHKVTSEKQANPAFAGDEMREPRPRRRAKPPEKTPNVLNVSWPKSAQKPAAVKPDPRVRAEVKQIKRISDEAEKIAMLLSDEESIDVKVSPPKAGQKRSDVREPSKPLNNTLTELSQQVSAIREYTAYQQNRLEKLQDGYDWNIIRTFCLRVIRCIDNLENRLGQMSDDEVRATHLEEVKDELVFALESSGIEQFRPEINSDYRGHEKYAEAVKDKQPCEKPGQTGKIAACLRPGYQYFINEDNVKVVRPAQVKLYA